MKKNDFFEVEVEALEVKFDDEHVSHQDCLQIMNKRKLIDKLFFGRITLLGNKKQMNVELFVVAIDVEKSTS